MNKNSYVLNELQKYTSTRGLSRAVEGLETTTRVEKAKILRGLMDRQNQHSFKVDGWENKLTSFQSNIQDKIVKIKNHYGDNPPEEIKKVINTLEKVEREVVSEINKFVEAESISRTNIEDLALILKESLDTKSVPSELSNFNNLENFINSSIHLQERLVKNYCNTVNFTYDNCDPLINKTNIFLTHFFNNEGSLLHATDQTLKAANSLIDILNLFC